MQNMQKKAFRQITLFINHLLGLRPHSSGHGVHQFEQNRYRYFFPFFLQHLKQIDFIPRFSAFASTFQFFSKMLDGIQV
jgi:hypothetical protein